MDPGVIYLCGFMTSGKSTIGPILANVLGWNFYDLDKVIEKAENCSVVDIFAKKGEDYFRGLESATLSNLSKSRKTIIALGGGTIANEKNLMLMKRTGTLVYLKVSRDMIYKRIKNKIDRPAFRDLVLEEKKEEEFSRKIDKMLTEREPYYMMADIIIETDETRIGLTVDNLVKKLKQFKNGKSNGTT